MPSPSPSRVAVAVAVAGRRRGELLKFLAGQPERGGADTDDIPLGQRCVRGALPVDEGAVIAAQVHDAVRARHVAQLGVVAGGAGIGDHDVVIQRPADAQRLARQRPHRARLAGRRDRLRPRQGLPGGGRAVPVPRADIHAGGGPGWRGRAGSADAAAQDRPVSWMAEPDLAFSDDLDPVHPPVSGKGAVGAAVVCQHPAAVLQPEHGMTPGHAGVGDHDVALRVAADQVRRSRRQAPVRSLEPHHEWWRGPPRKGLLSHAPSVGRSL